MVEVRFLINDLRPRLVTLEGAFESMLLGSCFCQSLLF